jgi:ABC-type lipoprotein release transport system permease subunit
VLAECAAVADDAVMLGEETASHLNVAVGDEVWVLPME